MRMVNRRRRKKIRFDLFRNSKIGDFDDSLVIDEDVGTLDIPMNDISLVQVVESAEDLADKVADQGFFKGAVLGQELDY
jgi:hypothetical protein